MQVTGPNTSSRETRASRGGSSSTVGLSVVSERRSPRQATCPPPATASSTQEATDPPHAAGSRPTSVSGRRGSPTRSAPDTRCEPLQELGLDVRMDEDALGRHANLSGVVYPPLTMGSMMRSRSALRSTMAGATPPCSKADRVPARAYGAGTSPRAPSR